MIALNRCSGKPLGLWAGDRLATHSRRLIPLWTFSRGLSLSRKLPRVGAQQALRNTVVSRSWSPSRQASQTPLLVVETPLTVLAGPPWEAILLWGAYTSLTITCSAPNTFRAV